MPLTKDEKKENNQYYLSRLKKNRDWKAKHKVETKAYMKERLSNKSIRERYNLQRRNAWAQDKANGPVRARGRPRNKLVYDISAQNVMNHAVNNDTVNVAGLIRDSVEKEKFVVKVPADLPQKFKTILGESVTIPAAVDQWYFLAANN